MNRKLLSLIASCLAIGMSACTTFRPPLNTAKACADWRWIGISRPEVQCPEIPGWTVRPLFPQLAPAQQKSEDDFCKEEDYSKQLYCHEKHESVTNTALVRELNRFCVYEPKLLKKIFKKALLPPGPSGDLVRLDQDCAALSVADTELDSEDWKSKYKSFLSETGQQGTPLQTDHAPGVRLAFLDSEPTGEGLPATSGRYPHGYTLANIARTLVCTTGPSPRCAAQITNQLALPIIKFNAKSSKFNKIDRTHGGFLGMQSDLAAAIQKEVETWLRDRQGANSPQHLVLNLSLAWDGRLFGGLGEEWINEMRAGSQAVYRALQYAADFDVLVLAAAGNQKREPCMNTGPLLPAAWEAEIPQEQGCHPEQREKPLLYAVGGVDSDGKPLANARPGGMPRRVAYGETAVVTAVNPRTTETTFNGHTFSGSSVSTAVVSSIAAVVWDLSPDLKSHEVMRILDESGDALEFKADFWFGDRTDPGPYMVHRLSLCKTLEKACTPPLRCPIHCVPWQPQPSDQHNNTWSQGSCQPWMFPQPQSPICPNCPP